MKWAREPAVRTLMELLSIEGLSGREGRVAEAVKAKLVAAGCEESWIKHDQAHRLIPGNFEIGNLIVQVPGTFEAPRRLFMGHLDTVPLCRGAVPVISDGQIVSKGDTALGGDNRTAVGCLLNLVSEVVRGRLDRPPLTLLFTVGEEIGLWGARTVELADLGHPALGFNVDSSDPSAVIIGAVGADRWECDVRGRSSHAGVHPEDGISAILIASRAVTAVAESGYFGKISRGEKRGTSNVGIVRGGEATNQVTDHVYLKGESRSHDPAFVAEITTVYREAFERAAAAVRNAAGKAGTADFRSERDYDAFRMEEGSPPVRMAQAAIRRLDREPTLRVVDGGLDANYLNAKGVPTVTLGAGQHNPHTVDEYVDLEEYMTGCRLLVGLATARE